MEETYSYQVCLTSSSEDFDEFEEIPSFSSENEREPPSKKYRLESTPTHQPKFERCKTCQQILEDVPRFNSIEFSEEFKDEILSEMEAVHDVRICVDGMYKDELQEYSLNNFSIYDLL